MYFDKTTATELWRKILEYSPTERMAFLQKIIDTGNEHALAFADCVHRFDHDGEIERLNNRILELELWKAEAVEWACAPATQ